jgi:hypothetical protein
MVMNKTKTMLAGVMATLVLAGCNDEQALPPELQQIDCDDWEWDDESGTFYCDDDDSYYRGHYYHGGKFYKSKSSLKQSSTYQSYYKGYKAGIGSGTKGGFGG